MKEWVLIFALFGNGGQQNPAVTWVPMKDKAACVAAMGATQKGPCINRMTGEVVTWQR